MKEIIKTKKPNIEFYLTAEDASQRYDKLMNLEKDVYMDPLFGGKLWTVTWYE